MNFNELNPPLSKKIDGFPPINEMFEFVIETFEFEYIVLSLIFFVDEFHDNISLNFQI